MNNTTSNKTSESRLNVLYILLTLKKYSSASHPLSLSELTEKTNAEFFKKFGPLEQKGLNLHTVTRTMDALCSDINIGFQNVDMDFYTDISGIGHNVYCVMETSDPDDPWAYYEVPDDGKKGPKKYYYYESVFTDAELTTLIDAVETYNYFSTDDISTLVSKLLGLRPTSDYLKKYDEHKDKLLKDNDSLVLANIDEFNRIIKAGDFAIIEYCSYDYNDKNHALELSALPKYPRLIRPLSMMWSNGYYYLVALLKGGYAPANLRMDRIRDITPCTPTEEQRRSFQVDIPLDTSVYRLNHPVMYGGELKHISIIYNADTQTKMNNAFMDTFGKQMKIRPASADEIKKHVGESNISKGRWLIAQLHTTAGGVELFATQYCRHCKVISPADLADKIADNLRAGLMLYQS